MIDKQRDISVKSQGSQKGGCKQKHISGINIVILGNERARKHMGELNNLQWKVLLHRDLHSCKTKYYCTCDGH